MLLELREYFLLFVIYSIIGWILEVIYTFVTDKKFTNRGFLIGPYCPIYGVGAVLVILLLSQYKEHPIGLFVLAIVICSILEYFTSYIMEKLFNTRWWDYSNRKFNINGRICMETMVPFGIVACLLVYIINPFLVSNLYKLPDIFLTVVSIFLAVLLISDYITSFNIINNFKKTVKEASDADRTEDINKYVKNLLLEKSILHRRLIKAFPKIQTRLKEIKKNYKEKNKKD
ncbi:MAG: putative ABC transporter permease [Bacilli bacterium]